MAKAPDSKGDPKAEIQARLQKRVPFSGDPNDPEGKSEENKKKREKAEREHEHK